MHGLNADYSFKQYTSASARHFRRTTPQANKRGREAYLLVLILAGAMATCFIGMTLFAWVTRGPVEEASKEDTKVYNSSTATLTPAWSLLARAWDKTLLEQRMVAGGSTITKGAETGNKTSTPRLSQLPPGEGLHLTLSAAEARAAVDLMFEFIEDRLVADAARGTHAPPPARKRRGWQGDDGLTMPPAHAARSTIADELNQPEANLLYGLMQRVWKAHPPAQGEAGRHEDHCSTPQVGGRP